MDDGMLGTLCRMHAASVHPHLASLHFDLLQAACAYTKAGKTHLDSGEGSCMDYTIKRMKMDGIDVACTSPSTNPQIRNAQGVQRVVWVEGPFG